MASNEEINTATDADLVKMEKLREKMSALVQRMDRLLVPLREMRNALEIEPSNTDKFQQNQPVGLHIPKEEENYTTIPDETQPNQPK